MVVRPSGEDVEHLFEFASATVDSEGRQDTVYLEDLHKGRLDPPQGTSRKNTPWQGPLQHKLCVSVERDLSLPSPMYSLQSDSPHQWSEHRPGTTSAGLCMTHKDNRIAIPSLPPPLMIGVSDDRVKGGA